MDHKEFEQALCKKLGTTPDKATPQHCTVPSGTR